MTEVWKPIPGFEGLYEVSDQGRVRSLDRQVNSSNQWGGSFTVVIKGRVLAPSLSGGPYRRVNICKDGRRRFRTISSLVAETFLGPRPVGCEVRHLNGVSTDDRLANLAYGTPKQNAEDRDRHGTTLRGEDSPVAKLSEADVRAIRAARGGSRQVDIAAEFGVNQTQVSRIQRGEAWRHV